MVRTTARVALTFFVTLTTTVAAMAAPKIGEPAPAFSVIDSKGTKRNLAEFSGKTVVLEWSNDGCPFVRKHYDTGNMQALQRETTAAGIVWLTVVSSARGTQGYVEGLEADELTATRKAAPTAVLLDADGKVGRLYDARTTPHMYVIAPDGRLAYRGAIDDKPTTRNDDVKTADNYVRRALAAVAAGKPADPSVTRPYGCSVKYAD
jgi:peroxiredoxin